MGQIEKSLWSRFLFISASVCKVSILLAGFGRFRPTAEFGTLENYHLDVCLAQDFHTRERTLSSTAYKEVNGQLASFDLTKYPDKTFIGCIEKGFGLLGYHFSQVRLSIAIMPI